MVRSTFFLFFMAACVGVALFQVKHEVLDIEQQLKVAVRQISHEEDSLHVLKAEWSYLNEPSRLQALAEKYLDVAPVGAEQMVTLTSAMDQAMSPGIIATRSQQVDLHPRLASWGGN